MPFAFEWIHVPDYQPFSFELSLPIFQVIIGYHTQWLQTASSKEDENRIKNPEE